MPIDARAAREMTAGVVASRRVLNKLFADVRRLHRAMLSRASVMAALEQVATSRNGVLSPP